MLACLKTYENTGISNERIYWIWRNPPPFFESNMWFQGRKNIPNWTLPTSPKLPTSNVPSCSPQKKFVRVKIVKIEIQVHALKAINHGSHTGTTWSHGRSPPDEVCCADWKRTPTKWWTNYMHIICMYIDINKYREREIYILYRESIHNLVCPPCNRMPVTILHGSGIPKPKNLDFCAIGVSWRESAFPVLGADVKELCGQASQHRSQPKTSLYEEPPAQAAVIGDLFFVFFSKKRNGIDKQRKSDDKKCS